MARRKAANAEWGNDDSPPVNHNAKERDQIIRDACAEIAKLDAERQSIGEQIRAIKQVCIKGVLGMKISDFDVALRLYGLEGKDRDDSLNTLRETFDALGVGEQLDWLRPHPAPDAAQ